MSCPYTESHSCNSFESSSNAYVHFFSAEISLCLTLFKLTVKHTGDFSKGKKCRNSGGTTDDACLFWRR